MRGIETIRGGGEKNLTFKIMFVIGYNYQYTYILKKKKQLYSTVKLFS